MSADPRRIHPWADVLLYLSAYAPLPFLLIAKYWSEAQADRHLLYGLISACLAGLLSVGILAWVVHSIRGDRVVQVVSVQAKPGDLVNYAMPYVVSLLGIDFNSATQTTAFVLFLLLLAWMSVRTGIGFVNPILALLGYGLYEVEYDVQGYRWKSVWLSKRWIKPGDDARVLRLSIPLEIVTT